MHLRLAFTLAFALALTARPPGRGVDPSVTTNTSEVRYQESRAVRMLFGRRADGQPYGKLLAYEPYVTAQGPEYTISGDPEAYHRYDLIFRTRFHHVEMRIGNDVPVPVMPTSRGGLKALYAD